MTSWVERWADVLHARFAAPLPAPVSQTARWALRDAYGLALSGSVTRVGGLIRRQVADAGGSAEGTLLGSRDQVPAAQAAFANAVCVHALDLDDGHRLAAGHPGAPIIPAALAAGERDDASGATLMRAIALGYETFVALGAAVNPDHLRRGYHTTSTVGAIAAAAAAGLVRGLDRAALADALALAALQSGGLLEVVHDAAEAKPFQVGRASAAGVLAAELAGAGLSGPATAIEGRHGWLAALTGDPDRQVELDGWRTPGIYFKRHASCRHTHPAIDAVLTLREDIGAIDAVEVRTSSVARDIVGGGELPRRPSDAKFSLPFCVALAYVRGSAGPLDFDEAAIADHSLRAIARRVHVVADPALDAAYPATRGAHLLVETPAGPREHFQEHAVGEPELPLGEYHLREKFLAEAGRGVGEEAAWVLADALAEPERSTCRALAQAFGELPRAGSWTRR